MNDILTMVQEQVWAASRLAIWKQPHAVNI
jgi:hypothetical protein